MVRKCISTSQHWRELSHIGESVKQNRLTTVGVLDGKGLDVEANDSLGVLAHLVVLNNDVHVVVQNIRLGTLHVTWEKIQNRV